MCTCTHLAKTFHYTLTFIFLYYTHSFHQITSVISNLLSHYPPQPHLLFDRFITVLYNVSSWNYMPTIQKIYYIYTAALALKDVEFPFMEPRFHHLIFRRLDRDTCQYFWFSGGGPQPQMCIRFIHNCVINSTTNQYSFICYWMMVQDQYWFYLPIPVFLMHDLQTESDQLLIKSNTSLTHCTTILHLKEQKYV